ncbi:ATP-binding protein [Planktotalea sp.]|uniref:two-component system sensor histidine kinase NtrB n=1 Tax=Planktotalea sp. TaxID=2029877 RepID=UPI003D6B9CFB
MALSIEYWFAVKALKQLHLDDLNRYLERVRPSLIRAAYQINSDAIGLWLEGVLQLPSVVAVTYQDTTFDFLVGDAGAFNGESLPCSHNVLFSIADERPLNFALGSGDVNVCVREEPLGAVALADLVASRFVSLTSVILSALLISVAVFRIVVAPVKKLSKHLADGLPVADFQRFQTESAGRNTRDELDVLFDELKSRSEALRREQAVVELSLPEIQDAIVQTNAQFQVLRSNKSFQELVGDHKDEVDLTELFDLRGIQDSGSQRDIEGPNGRLFELRLVRVGGSGPESGFLFFIKDQDEQQKEENDRIQKSKLSALGTLASGIAHDFNNILSVILANIELVQDKEDISSSAHDHFESIIKYTERGASLANQMLSFARQNAQNITVFKAAEAIHNIAGIFQPLAGKQIRLRIEAATDAYIKVDRGSLETALLNLLVNSKSAVAENSNGAIELRAVEVEIDGAHYISFEISDNGVGMPREVLERVEEPFFTTKSQSEGSGLGVAMVSGFAKQSNGKIEFESVIGKGTTAKLVLPIYEGDIEASDIELDVSPSSATREKQKILIVEDEVTIRDILAFILAQQGYDVQKASSISDIRAGALHKNVYDLVICDLILEDCTATEVLVAFSEVGALPDFLLISGNFPEKTMQQCKQFGDFRQLRKPFRNKHLLDVVAQQLGRPGG